MSTKPTNSNPPSMTERWQPVWAQIPSHIVTLSDYEQAARLHLPTAMQAILFENNLAPNNSYSNASALDNKRWLPRMLDPKLIDLSCHLYNPHSAVALDIRLPHPLWLSPVAHQGLYHPQAEKATFEAANLLNTPCIFSSQGNTLFTELLPNTTVANAVQWYWQSLPQQPTQPSSLQSSQTNNKQARRDYNLQLIEKLAAQGMQLLVITVDAPHSGVRAVSRRAQVILPSYCQAINLPQSNHINGAHAAQGINDLLAQAPDWADIEWLLTRCPVPVLLKGILHPSDAKRARDIGCAGIVASNHGQRVLADAIAVADILPELRQSVGNDMVIIADGGVRSGSDMAKLIALGADAVGIGRGYIYGLALAGALGVAHVNKLLLEELQVTMATLGAANMQALRESMLR
ncbi:alpha-hydroxy-acid oxidizing protein [uncultured Psychrobacter sp.]|uniref:alpha-hydroxy acid oxidase n=1 Tax=uncultured Psychrobacter sp. TaxID=259303 RepID=UPI00345A9677